MQINIQENSPTVSDIESEKSVLSIKTDALFKSFKNKVIIFLLGVISIVSLVTVFFDEKNTAFSFMMSAAVMIVIVMNLDIWVFLKNKSENRYMFKELFYTSVLALFSSLILAKILVVSFTGVSMAHAFSGGLFGFVVILYSEYLIRMKKVLDGETDRLKSLGFVESEKCAFILSWLKYSEIKNYHESVVIKNNRKFMTCEFDAMRDLACELEEQKNQEVIEKNCHRLYVEPVLATQ